MSDSVAVPVDELATMAERMEKQAAEIARIKGRLAGAQEAQDALVRLIENMKEAAGIEDESDPIEARLREKSGAAMIQAMCTHAGVVSQAECPWCQLAAMTKRAEDAEVENKRLQVDAWCDVCCGKGKLVSGRECICGGTGQKFEALNNLRILQYQTERERDALRKAFGSRGDAECQKCQGTGFTNHNTPSYWDKPEECDCRKRLGL